MGAPRPRAVASGRWRHRGVRFVRVSASRHPLELFNYRMACGVAAVRARSRVRARHAHAGRSCRHGVTMPIVVKLDDMLHARRMTLTELADRMGITLANLSILKTGK